MCQVTCDDNRITRSRSNNFLCVTRNTFLYLNVIKRNRGRDIDSRRYIPSTLPMDKLNRTTVVNKRAACLAHDRYISTESISN